MNTGLREQKKRATRVAIADIATGLFERDGFDAVSIAQIAGEAGVAKMTVTNYFARKEDLVFDRHEQVVSALAATVTHRAAGESPLEAIRRDYLAAVARHDVMIGFGRVSFARMIEQSPTLVARLRELMDLRERALADVLREVLDVDDVMALFHAARLASVHRILFTEARRSLLAGHSAEDLERFLTSAATRMFDLLAVDF
jgi:AcrR family transcriptional regulator